jgi:thiol-disulfide isomerase/thioredoxin
MPSELRQAPELRINRWIGGEGQDIAPLRLADLGKGFKIIYCFQHWCPGCHSGGFPSLMQLHAALSDKGFGFAVIQTVFEGFEENSFDKLRLTQKKYGLNLPFGHDIPDEGQPVSTFMLDYQTGGTPWFTVIDPAGRILYADFQIDPAGFLQALSQIT